MLDLGCGPGVISVRLAAAEAPGALHGIDMEASQIEMANAAAKAGRHGNDGLSGGRGDRPSLRVTRPSTWPSCHALINHAPDTQAVIAEVKRFLKPGGLFATREVIGDSSLFEPAFEMGISGWSTFLKMLSANGGHPQMGKELKRALCDSRLRGHPRDRVLRTLQHGRQPRVSARLDHRLVLCAIDHGSRDQAWSRERGAVQRLASVATPLG